MKCVDYAAPNCAFTQIGDITGAVVIEIAPLYLHAKPIENWREIIEVPVQPDGWTTLVTTPIRVVIGESDTDSDGRDLPLGMRSYLADGRDCQSE